MFNYRNIIYLLTAVSISVFFSVKSSYANIVYTHPQTGISFPSEIDPLLTFSGLDNYEEKEKGLGVGLRYDNSKLGIKANIYLYNHGKKNIPDGTSSSIIKESYKDSISEMYGMAKKGYYKNVKKLSDGIVSLLIRTSFLCREVY